MILSSMSFKIESIFLGFYPEPIKHDEAMSNDEWKTQRKFLYVLCVSL